MAQWSSTRCHARLTRPIFHAIPDSSLCSMTAISVLSGAAAPPGRNAAWLYNEAPFVVLAHNTESRSDLYLREPRRPALLRILVGGIYVAPITTFGRGARSPRSANPARRSHPQRFHDRLSRDAYSQVRAALLDRARDRLATRRRLTALWARSSSHVRSAVKKSGRTSLPTRTPIAAIPVRRTVDCADASAGGSTPRRRPMRRSGEIPRRMPGNDLPDDSQRPFHM